MATKRTANSKIKMLRDTWIGTKGNPSKLKCKIEFSGEKKKKEIQSLQDAKYYKHLVF